MPNGNGLNGNYSSTQSALIIPMPFSTTKYYVFTTDAQAGVISATTCSCLAYSLVDMSFNGGLGDVTVKNSILHAPVTEKLTAYKHANDSCIWLVAHEWGSDHFLSYLISPSGVNATPVVSATGSSHCCTTSNANAIGQMKISPDGTKLAYILHSDEKIELFKFDRSSGRVSDPVSITADASISFQQLYGLEFSPNSSLVYVTTNSLYQSNHIIQFSLKKWNATDVGASRKHIQGPYFNPYIFGQAQLAPDGKIYVSNYGSYALGVINSPDSIGTKCSYAPFQTPTNGKLRLGLPNYMPGFYRTPPPPDDAFCDSEPVIPNVVTPNGDGINDDFKISCNGYLFIPESLTLYNRWGKEVYHSDKQGELKRLSDGTYFYVLRFNDSSYKGYLTVLGE